MQEILVNIHSVWRWVVLLTGVPAIVLALMSAMGSRPWDALSDRFSFFFPLAMDIQVLVGLLVWLVEQRWTGDLYIGWLHPIAMLVAVGLAHAGRSAADRAEGSANRGRRAATFFIASVLVVLVAIPLYSWPL